LTNFINIAVDSQGGDKAPAVVLEGVLKALSEFNELKVTLVGKRESCEPFAAAHPELSERLELVFAEEVIEMHEHPANAVRTKKDSSIVVACNLLQKSKADAFFSAGSTGACLAAATIIVGRIKGVLRPALATVVPTPNKPIILLDIGANADCNEDNICQFALMGSSYSTLLFDTQNPSVALLNNGSEDTKGSIFAQNAHAELKEKIPEFVGNAEGGDIMKGTFDVIVTDGFSGNIALKSIEGASKIFFNSIKGIMKSTLSTKIAALLLKAKITEFANTVNPDTYGGVPLLGLKKSCIIGHGSSNPTAIKNGIGQCILAVKRDLPAAIASRINTQ
jgi:glycerol-3-phosphate acyltransferase PlsX